jgi:hypothetical protein
MDAICSQTGQISTPEHYHEISTSRKEEPRMPIKETSGLLYWDQSRLQGLSPWEHNDDDIS